MSKLKVLIVGIGSPIPTFIFNRLRVLDNNQIELLIVINKSEYGKFKSFKNATLIRYDLPFFALIFKVLRYPLSFMKLFNRNSTWPLHIKFKWVLKQMPLIGLKSPNIIHIQWITMATQYAWLSDFYNLKFIGSARGSQATIYPAVRVNGLSELVNSFRVLDYVHCVSKDIAKACIRYGCDQNKIKVIYNGVDVKTFRRIDSIEKSSANGSKIRIISVGALMWRKGYLYQLQLMQRLSLKYDVELMIIGDGVDKELIKYTAKVLDLESKILLVGKLSHEEIIVALNKSDIYLSTSIAEGLPNSLMEAAACSLPIVSFSCEGVSEIIDNEITGYIVPFGDIDSAFDKLENLILNKDLRDRIGNNAREKMCQEYDIIEHNTSLVNFYNYIANEK